MVVLWLRLKKNALTRRKHDARFPHHAIDFCLQFAGLSDRELDYVAFYDKPLRKFERILKITWPSCQRATFRFAKRSLVGSNKSYT